MSITFITNDQLYKQAIEPVAKASSFVWIGTADIKDLHVHHKGSVQSFLAVLDGLLKKESCHSSAACKRTRTCVQKKF
jgi:hypothetical protein